MTDAAITAPPAAEAVSVRMYKGLLGDCFLLKISGGGASSHVLIDCGILQGIEGGGAYMKVVAGDILERTGGKLDLVVVTHQHADHISGFSQAADVFFGGRMQIGRLWMGWTENGADPQAKALAERFDKARMALAAADDRARELVAGLKTSGRDVPPSLAARARAPLSDFTAPVAGAAAGPSGSVPFKRPVTGAQIMEALKAAAGEVDYLEPGQILRTPGAVGLKTYVMGPPRSQARLFKSRPSSGDNKETYAAGDGLDAAEAILSAAEASTYSSGPGGDMPFSRRYTYPQGPIAEGGPELDPTQAWLHARYYGCEPWRNIDYDWLTSTSALALKLDANTNNTSLVLAFETPAGKVLLFAADAQVGNWLSWHDQTYPPARLEPRPDDAPALAARDILSRVVLYKVGHHASHNATLDADGLELMTAAGLTAMIPVVETYARAQGSGWNMPYPDLLKRLLAKTQGRVLRGDTRAGLGPDGEVLTQDPAFLNRIREDDLSVEYELPPEAVTV
jgi:metallo-beta-lactamase superfamily protein